MNNTNIISKYYKFTKSYFLSSDKLIVKDSIVVVDKEFRYHKTSGRELLPHYRCTIQGTHSNYNYKNKEHHLLYLYMTDRILLRNNHSLYYLLD
mgnify:CR=1 FL=1